MKRRLFSSNKISTTCLSNCLSTRHNSKRLFTNNQNKPMTNTNYDHIDRFINRLPIYLDEDVRQKFSNELRILLDENSKKTSDNTIMKLSHTTMITGGIVCIILTALNL
ncbi:hypothetical protein QJ854_gp051 [Moumouvirus goulette]|uniref:Uncharacterized protein n=1 Tax=Moumouvirus goulette TaxID=1247379 RepID=M1PNW6_9VIRU|nr:hypothetical protein QJ854_gp051 [Moumouvirus goulette]AGF85731.1 hypothetical protein glt_00928 [Moumouvirus goulette]